MLLDRSLVGDLPFFVGLDPDGVDEVLSFGKLRRFDKNATVFEQEQEADSFFLLLYGRLRIARITPAGQQMVVRFIGPGELCGIAVAIGKARYPAFATAAVESVVVAWPSASWSGLVRLHPSLMQAALASLGQRLQEAHERLVEISTEDVERRVAHAVLRLLHQSGRPVEGGTLIDFPISRQDIAELTGSTLYTVSRILCGWEGRGWVKSGRQRVVVRNPQALAKLTQDAPSG